MTKSKYKIHVIRTKSALEALVGTLGGKEFSLDLECTDPHGNQTDDALRIDVAKISIISLARLNNAWVIPVQMIAGEPCIYLPHALKVLQQIVDTPGTRVNMHNRVYDNTILRRLGVRIPEPIFCTMIAAWAVDPDDWKGLKDQCKKVYLSLSKHNSINWTDTDAAMKYAGEDSLATTRLKMFRDGRWRKQGLEKIYASPGLERSDKELKRYELEGVTKKWYEEVELPVAELAERMMLRGVKIDTDYFDKFAGELREARDKIEADLFSVTGTTFNPRSNQQVARVFYDCLGLEEGKLTAAGHKNKTGESFDEQSIFWLLDHTSPKKKLYQGADLLLKLRKYERLIGNYADNETGFGRFADADGIIHALLSTVAAKTGRWSISKPPLQQVPSRSELGRKLRLGFVPRPGYDLWVGDFKQIEIVLFASMSEEPMMLEVLLAGGDIHQQTQDKLGLKSRVVAKGVNFGLIYGMYAATLRASCRRDGIDLTVPESESAWRGFHKLYPGVRQYWNYLKRTHLEQGYVPTICGRHRVIDKLFSSRENVQDEGVRELTNNVTQGSAADLIKLAMLRIDRDEKWYKKYGCHMLLQVHDELVMEVPKDRPKELTNRLAGLMAARPEFEPVWTFDLPIKAEAGTGPNWLEAKP